MKRIISLVLGLTMIPAVAYATEVDDLLQRGREAEYTAEQLTTCTTPDGVRDALVRIEQSGAEIRVGGESGTELAIGAGGWALHRGGGLVEEALIGESSTSVEPLYQVEDLGSEVFMGRDVDAYNLVRDDILRARLVFDEETNALVRVVTYDSAGDAYCDRRFVSFDPENPNLAPKPESHSDLAVVAAAITSFPEDAAGFTRLDQYEDSDGFRFAYYSDGFFSFAVFEAPTRVELEGAISIQIGGAAYRRVFTAGQVVYGWESMGQGMALVGDLPPDLHEAVLGALPVSTDPGFFRRIWRSLFG
jgi:hypothetical protein